MVRSADLQLINYKGTDSPAIEALQTWSSARVVLQSTLQFALSQPAGVF